MTAAGAALSGNARQFLLLQNRLEWACGNVREENMAGRVAIVTGGTRGIGAAVSRMLKDKGYKVAATYAGNDDAAQKFKAETGIAVYKFDVGDFAACQSVIAQIEKDLGPIEVLVNNAGITRDSTMRRLTRDMWDQVIDTNLGSCFNMSKAVWEGMNTRGFGRIVNIGSINGQGGQYGQVNYAAAKSGIHGFTKALAQEGASKGITVNAIAPGYTPVATPKEVHLGDARERLRRQMIDEQCLKRSETPDDLAEVIAFLASDGSNFITGQVLNVDGGWAMR